MGDYNSSHTGNIIDAAISAVIAGQAGIQGVKVNGTELTPDSSNKVDVPVPSVVQTTGTSTTSVMSQKAVTDAIGSSTSGIAGVKVNGVELEKDSANKVDVPVPVMQSSTGSSTSDGMTQAAITTALGGKVDTTSIVQATGESTTSVMSQNAVSEELDLKVDKETGKGLSTNDYTTTEKTKLSGIEAEANKTTVVQTTGESTTSVMSQKAVTDAIGSSVSGIAGVKVNGVELEKDAANKVDVPVPNLLTSTGQSTTAGMTQKAITDALSSKADSSSLSEVATSGSYDDLSDKPTIPTLLSTTGQSTTAGMTQKAITDAIGSSTSGIAGVKVNGVELEKDAANKVDVPVPVLESTTGSSTTAGMTQNAITTALADKINTSSVVQSTGTSTTNIMSQKAVTDAIGSISSGIAGVKVNGVELTPDQSNKVDVPVPSLLTSTGQSTTAGMTQKAITDALSSKADSSSLSEVATSGSYDDLSDKPTIPTLLSTTGQSTTAGMTQKAVTDELDKKSELHEYYMVTDKDNWVGESAPYTQVFDMSRYTIKGDVFFADLGSAITVDSLEDWSCISSVNVNGDVVTLTCLEDKPKDDLVVFLRGFTD